MKKISLLLFILSFTSAVSVAQVQINNSLNPNILVNDFFNSGVLVSVSNITFNGMSADSVSHQLGLFTGGTADSLNLESGLIMGTGAVTLVVPSGSGFAPWAASQNDPDIAMLCQENTNDCAILEFDVEVNADALAFNYVFASTEYAHFTCSNFNDAFGFFISGPGISGPFSNDAVNIATIPNTDIPVGVNTVNSGSPSGMQSVENCQSSNPNFVADSIYFINNIDSISSIRATGYTVNLEAFVEVINGETYHMKLAICDAADGALDSYVFLEEGSFEGRFMSDIFEHSKSDLLGLYPNPTARSIFLTNPLIENGEMTHISVIDIQGREMLRMEQILTGPIELLTNDLNPGIYVIRALQDSQLIATGKFVKK